MCSSIARYSIAVLALAAGLLAQTPRPNGAIVRPTGRVKQVAGSPQAIAVSPDGEFAAVLGAGQPGGVTLIAAKNEAVVATLSLPNLWQGLAFSSNGRLLYAGGGTSGTVYELRVLPEGKLELSRTLSAIAAADRRADDLIGDIAVSPDGRMLYAADVLHDQVLVINLSSGRVIERYPSVRRPARIAMHPDGKTYFVTSWADGTVAQYEALTGRLFNSAFTGPHAVDLVWRDKKLAAEEGADDAAPAGATSVSPYAARLFVPAANTNNVYVLGITSANELRFSERLNIGMYAGQPLGMTPSSVTLSPDQDRLYVVCSDANAIAVMDVSTVATRLIGFLPVGEYPTAVRTLKDGRLAVASASGSSVLFMNPPADEALALQSGIVMANSPLKQVDPRQRPVSMSPVPFTPGEPTPIEHVIYILKEGRPYTPASEQTAPNHFKLAREFASLGNFTATGNAYTDGFYWSTAAITPDFVRKLQAASPKPLTDELDIAGQPPAGYLWNQVPAKLYGIVPTQRGTRGAVVVPPSANAAFKGPDPAGSDLERARVFLAEFTQLDAQTSSQSSPIPKLMMLRLAGDRPGTPAKGQRTEQAAFAASDYALGLIVEKISHSKIWPKTAIFVLSSNANGATDHRATGLVISPYAVRGKATATPFNTLSVLRTMEHILGLAPMTLFDAGATPLDEVFQLTPDLRPYDAEAPKVSVDALVP